MKNKTCHIRGGKNDAHEHLGKPLPVYKVSTPLLKPEGGGVGDRNQRTSHKPLHKGILDPVSNFVLLSPPFPHPSGLGFMKERYAIMD